MRIRVVDEHEPLEGQCCSPGSTNNSTDVITTELALLKCAGSAAFAEGTFAHIHFQSVLELQSALA